MKKQHIQRTVLIIAALVIWGNNIIQIFTGILDQDESDQLALKSIEPPDEMQTGQITTEAPFEYTAKYRDPFRVDFLRNPAPAPRLARQKENKRAELIIPELKYRGVISSGSRKMVMIEKSNNEIVFCHVSDEVDGVQIQQINEDSLLCQFKTRRFWLKLNAR